MQEVFSNIIEELEIERTTANNTFMKYEMNVDLGRVFGLERAIEIVKKEAEQYDNGWIPCSVSMPEERDSMFAKFKGTKMWNDSMFEKISEEVNVTVSTEKGTKVTTHAHTTDGEWKCDLLRFNTGYRIIAWQPLPHPYQPKGDHDENTN